MSIRLKTLIGQFLQWADATLAENTAISYRYHLGGFLRATKNKEVENLCPVNLSTWGKSWHDYQAVMRCFRWAVTHARLIPLNPFEGMIMPCRNERQRILQPKEIARFLRHCRERPRNFLLALRECYARPQEIRAVCWDDLRSELPELEIDEALQQGKAIIVLREFKDRRRRKDTNRPRVLLISKRLGRLLVRLRAKRSEEYPNIFLNSLRRPWTNSAVRCVMRRLRKRLGVTRDKHGETVVAYTFRHSQATLAASKGIRDRVLADILGHVETRTTARYQHLQIGHLREALDRIDSDRRNARKNQNRNA